MVDAIGQDDEALVGEECHIVAQSPHGPRGGGEEHSSKDTYENLILLCRNDHRIVDYQTGSFSPEKLRELKQLHEEWVKKCLDVNLFPQTKVNRAKNEASAIAMLIASANQLLGICAGSCAGDTGNDDLRSEAEVELVGDFLQELQDWLDLYNELDVKEKVRTEFSLGQSLKALQDAGFVVYAARLDRTIEINGRNTAWPTAVVRVLRIDEERERQKAQSELSSKLSA